MKGIYNTTNKLEQPKIIYENKYLFGIYKPPYWKVQVGYNPPWKNDVRNPKNFGKAIIQNWLVKNLKYNLSYSPNLQYGIINRLDRPTSGVLIVAKKKKYYQELRNVISDKKNTEKYYMTLIKGKIPKSFGYINKKISKYFIERDGHKIIFSRISGHGNSKQQNALTVYNIMKVYKYKGQYYTLLLVRILTGRTHQIRVHMKDLGTHIMTDPKYSNSIEEFKEDKKIIPRLFLHAYRYTFKYNNENIKIISKLPKDLKDSLKKMEEIKTNDK